MNLLERIDRWGAVTPTRLAHVSGDRSLTYGDLVVRSDRLARYLIEALPRDGSPIVVYGHKQPEMLIAFLGAVKAGHPYVPVDTGIPEPRVQRIISAAGARLTLTPERVAALTASLEHTTSVASPESGSRLLAAGTPYYIIFTSGSTGEPKGVVITFGCLASFLTWMMDEQAFVAGGETFLNQAPFSFDLSVMDLYLSLATGGTLFSLSRDELENPVQLYRALPRSNATVWVSTPSFAQLCLADKSFSADGLPRLAKFLFCGETLAPETAAELLARFPTAQVWNTYGPTEATVATTSVRIDHDILARWRPLPVGYPKPDSRVLVRREDGRPAENGERGEIIIAGPNVSPGYLGRPQLTEKAFFEIDGARAYHTGDWGRFEQGLLFFEGRRDDQIKLHGHRIELGDVEANLRALAGVADAVVVPKAKQGLVESLAAFVILHSRPAGSDYEIASELRDRLAEHLPAYMLPRRFYLLDKFPLTINGKIDRHALAQRLG